MASAFFLDEPGCAAAGVPAIMIFAFCAGFQNGGKMFVFEKTTLKSRTYAPGGAFFAMANL